MNDKFECLSGALINFKFTLNIVANKNRTLEFRQYICTLINQFWYNYQTLTSIPINEKIVIEMIVNNKF
jgi:hypothetical protein